MLATDADRAAGTAWAAGFDALPARIAPLRPRRGAAGARAYLTG